ncbi:DUF7261 family protein [Haloarcula marina]|uniref:DUF7261 family protein n=1 Tax=Haloarcula marina TaxID=2961574 RepID=UPI0020B8009F|nr:hypothetical protein [Halomicroarcula marina]
MANLSGDDRGQIILIAAFALAVTFVALALVVNSAIFTENLASRGETAGSDDALAVRAMAEANVGEAIEATNYYNDSSESELEDGLRAGIRNVSTQAERQQVTSGALTTVTYDSHRDGARIVQNDSSQFLDVTDSTGDFTLVSGVERVNGGNGTRAFRMNITDSATTNGSALEVTVQREFATGNEDSWRMNVWNTSGDRTIHVRTIRNDGGTVAVEECTVESTGTSVHVDVTSGTVEGEPCSALRRTATGSNFWFGAGTGASPTTSYSISFENGSSTVGNYSMVVLESGLSFGGLGGLFSDQPRHVAAIYDARVRYTYTTDAMEYATDVRVAPGEPRE